MKNILFALVMSILGLQSVQAETVCVVDGDSQIKIFAGGESIIVTGYGWNKSEYREATTSVFDGDAGIQTLEFMGDKSYYGNTKSKLSAVLKLKSLGTRGWEVVSGDFTFTNDQYFQSGTYLDIPCFRF